MTVSARIVTLILWTTLWATVATAKSGFFDSNGVRIHYVDEGRGVPVLLLHGFTGNMDPSVEAARCFPSPGRGGIQGNRV